MEAPWTFPRHSCEAEELWKQVLKVAVFFPDGPAYEKAADSGKKTGNGLQSKPMPGNKKEKAAGRNYRNGSEI